MFWPHCSQYNSRSQSAGLCFIYQCILCVPPWLAHFVMPSTPALYNHSIHSSVSLLPVCSTYLWHYNQYKIVSCIRMSLTKNACQLKNMFSCNNFKEIYAKMILYILICWVNSSLRRELVTNCHTSENLLCHWLTAMLLNKYTTSFATEGVVHDTHCSLFSTTKSALSHTIDRHTWRHRITSSSSYIKMRWNNAFSPMK